MAFVDGLFETPGFRVLVERSEHAAVLRTLGVTYPAMAGRILHDFHTVVLMREHGVDRIYSADAHFRRFAHLRVVNPLVT